jgi:acylphosphatase
MRSVHVTVSGRVQGVGYRAWVEEAARAAGLGGWVRNRRDGTVEAVLSGEDIAVAEIIEAMWQGPGAAHVANVEVAAYREDVHPHFRVLPTA